MTYMSYSLVTLRPACVHTFVTFICSTSRNKYL